MFWLVVRTLLGCSGWLVGHCCAVAGVMWVSGGWLIVHLSMIPSGEKLYTKVLITPQVNKAHNLNDHVTFTTKCSILYILYILWGLLKSLSPSVSNSIWHINDNTIIEMICLHVKWIISRGITRIIQFFFVVGSGLCNISYFF